MEVREMSTNVKITALQEQLLHGWCKSEYHTCGYANDPDEFLEDGIWSFSMIDNANVTPQKASGAIADLVKKNVIATAVEPGTRDVPAALCVALTDLGKEIVRKFFEETHIDFYETEGRYDV
jgi:hypothetical protein